MRLTMLALAASIFLFSGLSFGSDSTRDFKVSAIRVLNNSAVMRYHQNMYVTMVSGEVGKAGIPTEIGVGDTIRVEDREMTVKHIFATEALETLQYQGQILQKKGQVSCVLVESESDLPYHEEWADRLWVHVNECEPTAR